MIAKHFLNSHCNDSPSTATKDSRRKFRRRHSLSYKQIEAWDSEGSEEDRVDRSGTCFIWLKQMQKKNTFLRRGIRGLFTREFLFAKNLCIFCLCLLTMKQLDLMLAFDTVTAWFVADAIVPTCSCASRNRVELPGDLTVMEGSPELQRIEREMEAAAMERENWQKQVTTMLYNAEVLYRQINDTGRNLLVAGPDFDGELTALDQQLGVWKRCHAFSMIFSHVGQNSLFFLKNWDISHFESGG
ncbi:unnamed protein product [Cladocopium goreaui]|uniref:Uncharacterized protein n=1 Tax=Cladocopium goreaui TaxID=2562237 RepID=A0A9P1FDM5_9DINO|nr:unnamed protein product [Cladocopium goreaui]